MSPHQFLKAAKLVHARRQSQAAEVNQVQTSADTPSQGDPANPKAQTDPLLLKRALASQGIQPANQDPSQAAPTLPG
jgi:hypothetical protein